jgi:hypothetical protein
MDDSVLMRPKECVSVSDRSLSDGSRWDEIDCQL